MMHRPDDAINRSIVSAVNQCPTTRSDSIEGSYLLGKVGGMDLSRSTEARNLERFSLKAGFEVPATRFQDSNPEEQPSDLAD